MRLSDYECVRVLSEEGAFSAAAQRLGMTQPGLSILIARLEKQCGVKLVDRAAKPLKLTPEGVKWIEVEAQIEALRENRRRYFEDLNRLEGGSITIGANACRSVTMLPETLREFVSRYPAVRVHLCEVHPGACSDRLERGDFDFSVTLESCLSEKMLYRTVADEQVVVAVPPQVDASRLSTGHTFCDRPVFDFEPAADERFILLDRGIKFHDLFLDVCHKHGLEPDILLETESITTVMELVRQGLGFGVVPDVIARRMPETTVQFLSIQHVMPMNRVVVAWMKDRYLSRAAQTFIDMLCEHFRAWNTQFMTEPARGEDAPYCARAGVRSAAE